MSKRQKLLKRASNYSWVPGHGPNIEKMTDEELEKFLDVLDQTFEDAFEDGEGE